MGIHLIPENLDELDRQSRDLLVLTLFDDERPLRGLNGLVDWRFNGSLSRMLQNNRLDSDAGVRTLMPTNRRLPIPRLLVYGLGKSKNFDNMAFAKVVKELFSIIGKLKAPSTAMNIPGAHRVDDFLLERLAILIKESRMHYSGDLALFVGGQGNFKDIQAKFDLLQDEIDKVIGTNRRKG